VSTNSANLGTDWLLGQYRYTYVGLIVWVDESTNSVGQLVMYVKAKG